MDRWNKRYPAQLPVDIDQADIPQFLSAILQIRRIAWAAMEQSGEVLTESGGALERAVGKMLQAIRDMARESGYDSISELYADLVDAEKLETRFTVAIAEPLRDAVEGADSLTLTVRGVSSVAQITFELD